ALPICAVLAVSAAAAQCEAAAVRRGRAAAGAGRVHRHPALGARLRRPPVRRDVAPDPRHLRRLRRLPAGAHHRRLHPPRDLPPLTPFSPPAGRRCPEGADEGLFSYPHSFGRAPRSASFIRITQNRCPLGASITHQRFTNATFFAPSFSRRSASASMSSASMSRCTREGCETFCTSA